MKPEITQAAANAPIVAETSMNRAKSIVSQIPRHPIVDEATRLSKDGEKGVSFSAFNWSAVSIKHAALSQAAVEYVIASEVQARAKVSFEELLT